MSGPFSGRTVGVTADRRGEQLVGMLRERGAAVLHGPAMAITGPGDDAGVRAVTERLLAAPPGTVVVTTGTGMNGWWEAARGWGLDAALLEQLAKADIVVRGTKSLGAVRGLGLTESRPPADTVAELLSTLLASGVRGSRIAVQSHGEPMPGTVDALVAAGAEVTEVLPYRIVPPADPAPLDALIEATRTAGLDAVAFTSAAAVSGLLARADVTGARTETVAALSSPVLPACIGPVTAAPLLDIGIPATWPARYRTAALVTHLTERLPPMGN